MQQQPPTLKRFFCDAANTLARLYVEGTHSVQRADAEGFLRCVAEVRAFVVSQQQRQIGGSAAAAETDSTLLLQFLSQIEARERERHVALPQQQQQQQQQPAAPVLRPQEPPSPTTPTTEDAAAAVVAAPVPFVFCSATSLVAAAAAASSSSDEESSTTLSADAHAKKRLLHTRRPPALRPVMAPLPCVSPFQLATSVVVEEDIALQQGLKRMKLAEDVNDGKQEEPREGGGGGGGQA